MPAPLPRPLTGPGAACKCGREGCVIPAGKRPHSEYASPACRRWAYRDRQGDAPGYELERTSRAFWSAAAGARPPRLWVTPRDGSVGRD